MGVNMTVKNRYFKLSILLASGLSLSLSALAQTSDGGGVAASSAESNAEETTSVVSAPAASIEKFGQAPEVSSFTPSYDGMIGFLNSFSVIDKRRVKLNYNGIRSNGARPLVRELQALREIPVSQLSKADQLAYWLNLRNMLVIFVVASENAANIAAERGTFAEPGPLWTKKRIYVEDVHLSIDDIERGIILKHWPTPDVFYGLYQGVSGGPSLFKPGFRGSSVYSVLPKLGARYAASKKSLDISSEVVRIPEFYQWYHDVLFDGDDAKVLKHLKRVTSLKKRQKLSDVTTIEYLPANYDVDTLGKLRRSKSNSNQRVQTPPRSSAPTSRRSGS